MIVNDLGIASVAALVAEAKPPLVVDTNAVKTGTVALERFEPVARRHAKEVQRGGGELGQLALGGPLNRREAPHPVPGGEPLRVLAAEAMNHGANRIAYRDANRESLAEASGRPMQRRGAVGSRHRIHRTRGTLAIARGGGGRRRVVAGQWRSASVPSHRKVVNPVRPGREQRQRRTRVPGCGWCGPPPFPPRRWGVANRENPADPLFPPLHAHRRILTRAQVSPDAEFRRRDEFAGICRIRLNRSRV